MLAKSNFAKNCFKQGLNIANKNESMDYQVLKFINRMFDDRIIEILERNKKEKEAKILSIIKYLSIITDTITFLN